MSTYLVIRDNKTVAVLPNPTIKNGEVWFKGIPLIDGQSEAVKSIGIEAIKEMVKNKDFDKLPAGSIAKVGSSSSGLMVVLQSDYLDEHKTSITPAQKMRAEINDLYYRANKLEDSPSEDNVSGPIMMRSKAARLLTEWRTKYPADAARERKDDLMSKAQDLRSKAIGALTYDADGMISQEEQQKRHDDYINQAKKIEEEANKI